jgi:pyridoxine 5-phosphate synthase
MTPELHLNIDHIATVRQARKTVEPSPLEAVRLLEATKAAGITMHLREDRRHVNDEDIREVDAYLRAGSRLGLTFEMGATEAIRTICLSTKAKLATLVPEKREELTTEGGLDVFAQKVYLTEFIKPIKDNGTKISMFVDPVLEQIDASKEIGAQFIELHTGTYANLFIKYHGDRAAIGSQYIAGSKLTFLELVAPVQEEVLRLKRAVEYAQSLGLKTNLGHGLTILNLPPLLGQVTGVQELHIGHSIVANSLYYGLRDVVGEFIRVTYHK